MMEATTTIDLAGMLMGLNIENEEAQHLATELAVLTGEPLTRAVIVALRERIARLRQQRHVDNLIARAQEIIRQSGGAAPYDNHAALLYDEHGLPK
jgi:antitoxin VapB